MQLSTGDLFGLFHAFICLIRKLLKKIGLRTLFQTPKEDAGLVGGEKKLLIA
jgi:hypothetical protein